MASERMREQFCLRGWFSRALRMRTARKVPEASEPRCGVGAQRFIPGLPTRWFYSARLRHRALAAYIERGNIVSVVRPQGVGAKARSDFSKHGLSETHVEGFTPLVGRRHHARDRWPAEPRLFAGQEVPRPNDRLRPQCLLGDGK